MKLFNGSMAFWAVIAVLCCVPRVTKGLNRLDQKHPAAGTVLCAAVFVLAVFAVVKGQLSMFLH